MKADVAIAEPSARQSWLMYRLDIGGRALTLLSIAFALIWSALAIYTWSMLNEARKARSVETA